MISAKGKKGQMSDIIPVEDVQQVIYQLRGQRVMLSTDLAKLYQIEPKVLMQAVKRNSERFPSDFMLMLTSQEVAILRSQFVTSSWGGRRVAPYAFTEQGVAMLSGVLNSPRAIQVNIAIMRTFARLRHILASHADLARKLNDLENKYDEQFRVVFDALREMMNPPEPPRKPIGFGVRERRAGYRVATRKRDVAR